jgi:PadR family transcriptional regulator PadR
MKSLEKDEIIKRQIDQLTFDLKRGFLQFVTLFLINQGPKYTYEIKDEVLKLSQGAFDIDRNNLYKKLRSLEKEGILKSHKKPSMQGADRKYYALTPFGKKLYSEMYQLLIPVMSSLHRTMKS